MTINKRLLQRLSLKIGVAAWLLILVTIPGHSSASSQSFQLLSGQPQNGMIMSLVRNPGVVEPANTGNAESLVGVIAPNDNNFSQQASQINVQTNGETDALVSTINGNIVAGDRITASAIQGVGAKANSNGWIVGVAQGSLDSKTKGGYNSTVTDSKGAKHTVTVALIPISVNVSYYSTATSSSTSSQTISWAPQIVQQIANSLGGKLVSTRALILSFILMLVGLFVAGSIIFSSVRSGFLAISRQPLSKRSILHEEWRSFALAILILAVVLGISLLALKFL